MNNILTHKGYRFYQSSYDEDGRGTWLSVNYDPWGTGLTYTGYLLLLIAMIGMMVHPRGGFRRLLKKATSKCDTENGTRMKRKEQTDTEGFSKGNDELRNEKEPVSFRLFRFIGVPLLMAVMAFAFVSGTFAQGTKKLPIVPLEEAEEKVGMQVIYHDRVVPLNTLARDFVKKLYGKESFSGLTPEQILLSWQRHPEEWAYVPAIKIKSAGLRAALGIEGKYARMVDLFEFDKMTTYRLKPYIRDFSAPTDIKPSPLQKAAIETDEKVALVMMLQNGTLIRPLPTDGSVEPLSKEKLQAELLYNRIPFTKILFMFNLTMGILILAASYKLRATSKSYLSLAARSSLLVALTFHLTGYLLRWYIGGRIPLSNGYETMQFLALCIMAFALFMSRRFRPALGFGFLLSGFTLLVAYLGQMNPQITPLMPVLVSPWLSLHVSVIMMAYALFAFILLNGVWALCLPREAEQLMTYSRLLLYPAVFLLTAGIFIGAVWANVSWSRYWGWDPKEVWALITMLIYALPLHAASLPWFKRPKFFHIYLIFAFLAVLITYFGVNFFLGGMHSYA
ncbi:MAG: cytochrome c biogenesis protein CcsA [Bacteroidaceae bacterium]|nr:cytochrome c biogenesis protein CcsA [Bacteroidaceae bacterium]